MESNLNRVIPAVAAAALLSALSALQAYAQAPTYSTLYDPLNVSNYHLTMSSQDWTTVKGDTSYTVEKPAWFNADGESKILISVRRKPTLAAGAKVSLKLDINEYFDGTVWHGVKKASLENGQQSSVLSEAFAWHLHVQAARQMNLQGTGYHPGKFTFANVYVNGAKQGLYTHVEQVDKQFLRNRDMWVPGETWLYKQQDVNNTEYDEGPTPLSPTRNVLNYAPFVPNGPTPPSDATLATQLPQYINMDAWLTMGAVNAFSSNPDNLFAKGKNYFWADYEDATVQKREYFPWDLDGVFGAATSNRSIYGSSAYTDLVLDHPTFRARYNQIMLELLADSLSVEKLHAYLNQLEPILTPHVLSDPNNNMGSPASKFAAMRDFVTQRHANVLSQVQADLAFSGGAVIPEPGAAALLLTAAVAATLRRRRHKV